MTTIDRHDVPDDGGNHDYWLYKSPVAFGTVGGTVAFWAAPTPVGANMLPHRYIVAGTADVLPDPALYRSLVDAANERHLWEVCAHAEPATPGGMYCEVCKKFVDPGPQPVD
jgi:hypothetical protein